MEVYAEGEHPRLIDHREWIDDSGATWTLRGHELAPKQIRNLIRRGVPRVLLVDGPRPRLVDGDELDALLARIEAFLADEAPAMNDFRVGEFRDAARRALVVVEESC